MLLLGKKWGQLRQMMMMMMMISWLFLGCLVSNTNNNYYTNVVVVVCDAFPTTRPLVPTTYKSGVFVLRSSSSTTVDNAVVPLKHVTYDVPTGRVVGGDPVILLHGLLGNKRNFHTLGTRLAAQLQTSRQVHCVDLRNHGDYTEQEWRDDMSYHSMAADVAAFLESKNIPKAVIIGHSMGGKVAKALALTHPHLVSGLVVLDIAPVKYTTEDGSSWKAITSILQSLKDIPLQDFTTKRQVDVYLQKHIEDAALRAFCLTNLDNSSSLKWKIPLWTLFQQLDNLADFDVVGQYTGDTFVIQGGASRFIKHSHMDTISNLFPNYMVTTIRGAGHWLHAEAPDDTLALLQKYLDR